LVLVEEYLLLKHGLLNEKNFVKLVNDICDEMVKLGERMIEKLLKDADALVKQLIEQYRGQFQKEYDSIKDSIQSMIDEVLAKFEQKIVANEKVARESLEKEVQQQLDALKERFEKLIEENNEFKRNVVVDIRRQEREMNVKLDALPDIITQKIAEYIGSNSKEIRKSFFNFKKSK